MTGDDLLRFLMNLPSTQRSLEVVRLGEWDALYAIESVRVVTPPLPYGVTFDPSPAPAQIVIS